MKNKFVESLRLLDSVPPVLLTLMTLSVVGMNLLANKSVDTGIPWLALDCGFILSWLAFLTMDVMTHCYGPKAATVGSLTAMCLNLFMAAIFFVGSKIPGVWGESFVDGSEAVINVALDHTFGGTWFVLLGSSIAFAVSAVANNFLNWTIGERLNSKGFGAFATRSYISTFIAQFIDNMTFALLVSRVFFGWTLVQCITCSITGGLIELLSEVLFSPMGYRISRQIMARRGEELAEEVA